MSPALPLIIAALFIFGSELESNSTLKCDDPIVTTEYGTIKGNRKNESGFLSDEFLGIRYGEIPKRFKFSRVNEQKWTGILNATDYGPECKQLESPNSVEDCLFINIWRPLISNKETRLPVFLWVHGSGYQRGSGARTASIDLGISEVSISYHYKMLRMVCYNVIHSNASKIGGPGKIVEIDETMVYRRKYNRGRLLSAQKKQVWVFGGIERESKLTFAEVVDKRDEETLRKVIEKYILPGTTIYSDGWKAYQNLSNYNFYKHDSVNHSKNFLNPLDKSVHTQTIERTWRSLKDHIPKSSHGQNRNDHLIEFLYKSKYHSKKEPKLNFETTLQHLKNDPYSLNYLDVYDYDD